MIVGERNYPLTEDDTPMTHSDTAMVHLSEAFRAGGGASVVEAAPGSVTLRASWRPSSQCSALRRASWRR